jgi:hypothetical protein
LAVLLASKEYVFATYTLGTLDNDLDANVRKGLAVDNNLGLWTYLWFGYSWKKQ